MKRMKSTTHKFRIEGAWGLMLNGPHALCGREQRGGVSICMLNGDGTPRPGGVLSREQVVDLHERLGKWIAYWAECDAKEAAR